METKNKQYLLYGGSGHAKVIVECINVNQGNVAGIFDDNPKLEGLGDIPFLGEYYSKNHEYLLIVSIGGNKIRKAIVEEVNELFGTICHHRHVFPPQSQ